MKTAVRVSALCAALILASCKGEIGSPPGLQPPDPNQPDPFDPLNPPPPPPGCKEMPRDPGRVTIHRLNRAEYNNTIRDLTGVSARPADDFPSDDHGYGFDNIADVLALAPALVEKYDLAAENVLTEIFAGATGSGPMTQQFEAERMTADAGGAHGDFGWNLYSTGELTQSFNVAAAGEFEIAIRAFGQQAGPEPARMELVIDNRLLRTFDVTEVEAAPGIHRHRATLTAGGHSIAVRFPNDYYMPPDDRNLVVDYVSIEGPFGANLPPSNPEIYSRVIVCQTTDETCAREIIDRFARRAWRRPLVGEELERLIALYQIPIAEGDPFLKGIELALHAVLLSPHFLFRVELDPDPTSLEPHPLTDHELASRLSYFLWSSMPDEELFARADAGTLHEPAVLQAEVARMLRDEKSAALVDNFAGQWLYTRALDDVSPDYATYPSWDEELRAAMAAESRMFFRAFLDEDRSALEMLDADFTFLNDRLARHYGLPPVGSNELQRVTLPAGQRGGLFTQGTILTVTSRPKRTSPVKRGKWVLEQILCQTPRPPPPGVEGLTETATAGSVRQRMEAHRTNPVCRSCHEIMDPLGFAMENFDGIGAWRTDDGGFAVDATGELPDGRSFDGARQLGEMLKSEPTTTYCFTQRLFTYAQGRGVEPHDACSIDDVSQAFEESGMTLQSLISSMTSHVSFTSRRGEAP